MGISIFTLGIGKDYNEDLLSAVAENSSGIWKHVLSPSDIPGLFTRQLEEAHTVIRALPDLRVHFETDVKVQEAVNALPAVFPVSNIKQKGADLIVPLSDIKAGEMQTIAFKLDVQPGDAGRQKLATVEIEGEADTMNDIFITYTTDEHLLSEENDAFPRGIFAAAQTQIRTKAGISGDTTALKQAGRMSDTIIRDPTLARIPIVRDAVENVTEAIEQARTGMTKEEKKIAKDGLTQIRRKQS